MFGSPRVLIFSTLFVLSTAAFAQQDPKETAREYMLQAELILESTKAEDDARGLMVTAADLDTTFLKANYEAARLHFKTINKESAVKYLLRVYRQDPEYRFDLLYFIGKGYQYGLDFQNALKYYKLYKDKLTKKPNYAGKDKVDMAMVDRSIFECTNGAEFVKAPKNYSIVNIGREINSEYDDYGPVLTEAEDEIVFTTRRREDNLNQNVHDDNKPFEEIFIATKKGDKWDFARNIGEPVNRPTHDSNLGISADGKTLFIYRDDNGGDIFYTENVNGKWLEPSPLPGIINSSFEEKSITISADGKTLYFASNRPGGYGGLDIYRATKDTKGDWSNVKNLGPVINTDLDEDGPFIDYDLVTLYFSSKGRKGMGDFDVFKSTYNPNSNEFSEPENLGYPINTPDADVYFVASKDGKRAYYSSVREDGMGYTDIYMVTVPEGLKNTTPTKPVVTTPPDTALVVADVKPVDPVDTKPVDPVVTKPIDSVKTNVVAKDPRVVQKDSVTTKPVKTPVKPVVKPVVKKEIIPIKYIVSVIDAATKSPLDAKVRMSGSKDNVMVGVNPLGGGVFEFSISSPTAREYRLSVESDGYVFQNLRFKLEGATDKPKEIKRLIEMQKLAVRVSGILRNIYFDFDRATFKTEAYAELNLLETMLRKNENLVVEIGGHTDAVGTAAYNLNLSQRRAEAVKEFLVKKGIDARRIKAVGYGKTKPLASNDDEDEGRELNRRVEFKVLSN